jgi:phosphoribosylformylglycinamidine (FGAM) synthase-like enzyme
VRTNTLVLPGTGDAAVLRVKGTARALALAVDGNGRWCRLAPKLGAMHAVAEAARNVACTGARPVAATNCLNFGNPEKPEVMWEFSEAVDGIAEACRALGTPITGGNVSFYNETLGQSIYPTPVVGVLGVLEDAGRALGMGFRDEGDMILFLDGSGGSTPPSGRLQETANEFGSSEYAKTIRGIVAGAPPAISLDAEKRLIDALVALASQGALRSAHDLSDGGLAVALAESCLASGILGCTGEIQSNAPAEVALFGECGARAVVSCAPASLARVVEIAREYGVAARSIGTVTPGEFRIEYNGRKVVSAAVESLRDTWEGALERALKG